MPSMFILNQSGTTVIRRGPCFAENAIREYKLSDIQELDHCEIIARELFERFEDIKPKEAAKALDILIKVPVG